MAEEIVGRMERSSSHSFAGLPSSVPAPAGTGAGAVGSCCVNPFSVFAGKVLGCDAREITEQGEPDEFLCIAESGEQEEEDEQTSAAEKHSGSSKAAEQLHQHSSSSSAESPAAAAGSDSYDPFRLLLQPERPSEHPHVTPNHSAADAMPQPSHSRHPPPYYCYYYSSPPPAPNNVLPYPSYIPAYNNRTFRQQGDHLAVGSTTSAGLFYAQMAAQQRSWYGCDPPRMGSQNLFQAPMMPYPPQNLSYVPYLTQNISTNATAVHSSGIPSSASSHQQGPSEVQDDEERKRSQLRVPYYKALQQQEEERRKAVTSHQRDTRCGGGRNCHQTNVVSSPLQHQQQLPAGSHLITPEKREVEGDNQQTAASRLHARRLPNTGSLTYSDTPEPPKLPLVANDSKAQTRSTCNEQETPKLLVTPPQGANRIWKPSCPKKPTTESQEMLPPSQATSAAAVEESFLSNLQQPRAVAPNPCEVPTQSEAVAIRNGIASGVNEACTAKTKNTCLPRAPHNNSEQRPKVKAGGSKGLLDCVREPLPQESQSVLPRIGLLSRNRSQRRLDGVALPPTHPHGSAKKTAAASGQTRSPAVSPSPPLNCKVKAELQTASLLSESTKLAKSRSTPNIGLKTRSPGGFSAKLASAGAAPARRPGLQLPQPPSRAHHFAGGGRDTPRSGKTTKNTLETPNGLEGSMAASSPDGLSSGQVEEVAGDAPCDMSGNCTETNGGMQSLRAERGYRKAGDVRGTENSSHHQQSAAKKTGRSSDGPVAGSIAPTVNKGSTPAAAVKGKAQLKKVPSRQSTSTSKNDGADDDQVRHQSCEKNDETHLVSKDGCNAQEVLAQRPPPSDAILRPLSCLSAPSATQPQSPGGQIKQNDRSRSTAVPQKTPTRRPLLKSRNDTSQWRNPNVRHHGGRTPTSSSATSSGASSSCGQQKAPVREKAAKAEGSGEILPVNVERPISVAARPEAAACHTNSQLTKLTLGAAPKTANASALPQQYNRFSAVAENRAVVPEKPSSLVDMRKNESLALPMAGVEAVSSYSPSSSATSNLASLLLKGSSCRVDGLHFAFMQKDGLRKVYSFASNEPRLATLGALRGGKTLAIDGIAKGRSCESFTSALLLPDQPEGCPKDYSSNGSTETQENRIHRSLETSRERDSEEKGVPADTLSPLTCVVQQPQQTVSLVATDIGISLPETVEPLRGVVVATQLSKEAVQQNQNRSNSSFPSLGGQPNFFAYAVNNEISSSDTFHTDSPDVSKSVLRTWYFTPCFRSMRLDFQCEDGDVSRWTNGL